MFGLKKGNFSISKRDFDEDQRRLKLEFEKWAAENSLESIEEESFAQLLGPPIQELLPYIDAKIAFELLTHPAKSYNKFMFHQIPENKFHTQDEKSCLIMVPVNNDLDKLSNPCPIQSENKTVFGRAVAACAHYVLENNITEYNGRPIRNYNADQDGFTRDEAGEELYYLYNWGTTYLVQLYPAQIMAIYWWRRKHEKILLPEDGNPRARLARIQLWDTKRRLDKLDSRETIEQLALTKYEPITDRIKPRAPRVYGQGQAR